MNSNFSKSCPCTSNESYNACCELYHTKEKYPTTALQLMRSRYSAYALRMVDYLVETTHKDKLKSSYKKNLLETVGGIEWIGLDILKTSLGQATDKAGKVKFKASYIENNQESSMVEHSRFRKYKERWYYYDGKG